MTMALVSNRKHTVQRLMEAFFAGRSEHTLRSYGHDLDDFHGFLQRAFALAMTRDEALRSFLTQGAGSANEMVLHYMADLRTRGKSPSTINRRLAALKSLTKLGNLIGMINWQVGVRSVPKEQRRLTHGPTLDEMALILAHTSTLPLPTGPRDHAAFRMLYDLGLRVSEVVRLDVEDFNLKGNNVLILGKGRTQKELLTIPTTTRAAVEAWLSIRGNHRGPVFTSRSPAQRRDGRLTTRGLYRRVRDIGADLGIKLWPHGLRHAAITAAVITARKNDIGIEEVRQFSRHKSLETLMIYRDKTRNVQGRLATLVSEAPGKLRDDLTHPASGARIRGVALPARGIIEPPVGDT